MEIPDSPLISLTREFEDLTEIIAALQESSAKQQKLLADAWETYQGICKRVNEVQLMNQRNLREHQVRLCNVRELIQQSIGGSNGYCNQASPDPR